MPKTDQIYVRRCEEGRNQGQFGAGLHIANHVAVEQGSAQAQQASHCIYEEKTRETACLHGQKPAFTTVWTPV